MTTHSGGNLTDNLSGAPYKAVKYSRQIKLFFFVSNKYLFLSPYKFNVHFF